MIVFKTIYLLRNIDSFLTTTDRGLKPISAFRVTLPAGLVITPIIRERSFLNHHLFHTELLTPFGIVHTLLHKNDFRHVSHKELTNEEQSRHHTN